MTYKDDKLFLALMKHVFAVEGGYLSPEQAKKQRDSGGSTKYGISYNNNAGYLKRFGVNKEADMVNLTREQAMQTAYDQYWIPSGGANIPDFDLAEIHFDAAFNCGVGQASRFLNSLSKNPAYYEVAGKTGTAGWEVWKANYQLSISVNGGAWESILDPFESWSVLDPTVSTSPAPLILGAAGEPHTPGAWEQGVIVVGTGSNQTTIDNDINGIVAAAKAKYGL